MAKGRFTEEFKEEAVKQVKECGYYAWLKVPESQRSKEDRRLLNLIRESYMSSGKTYFDDTSWQSLTV